MKSLFRTLIATLLLAVPALAHAQTQIDRTTFSVAVSATDRTVTLAAASGAAAGQNLFANGELFVLQTNTTGTTWTVRRSTGAKGHSIAETVWVGAGDEFKTFDPAGSCTRSAERVLPHINTRDNRIWDCAGTGLWKQRNPMLAAFPFANSLGGPIRAGALRDEFNLGHSVMQDDGTVKSLSDAEENFVTGSPLGAIEYREEQAKTVSSWVTINGELDISGDNTTTAEGVEIVFGAVSDAALNQVVEVGVNGACISAMITIADISAVDELVLGFRQNEAFADAITYETYGDYAIIGVQDTAGDVDVEDEEAGAGVQNDDAGPTWADGERRALMTCIDSAGVPTFYYTDASPDNDEPLYKKVTTTNTGDALTAGDGLIPFLGFLISGTDGPNVTIQWVQLEFIP